MYLTPLNIKPNGNEPEYFDWEVFFTDESSSRLVNRLSFEESRRLITKARAHLKENKFKLAFILNKMMLQLLKGREPRQPKILELGAATGFLTRWFIEQYGGSGVLVDKSHASHQAFLTLKEPLQNTTYLNKDIFELDLDPAFGLVCSFGLIEHFKDKKPVMDIHKKFLAPGGNIIILVPLDTPLTRTFMELHPEMNLGYRELLSEKEFKGILSQAELRILRLECSFGYSYDFIGALCTHK